MSTSEVELPPCAVLHELKYRIRFTIECDNSGQESASSVPPSLGLLPRIGSNGRRGGRKVLLTDYLSHPLPA